MIDNLVWIGGGLLFFAVVHSLTAGGQLKSRLQTMVSERFVHGWYRLIYNVVSAVTLLPVLAAYQMVDDTIVYTVTDGAAIGLRLLQLVGLLGLFYSLLVIDIWHFSGIRQAMAYLSGSSFPLGRPSLTTDGIYKFTRHPLYFFSMLFLWASPQQTVNSLILNAAITLYFIIGSRIEEGRMLSLYGDEYADYQKRVSWLIPWMPTPEK